jgi:hypothetical protein
MNNKEESKNLAFRPNSKQLNGFVPRSDDTDKTNNMDAEEVKSIPTNKLPVVDEEEVKKEANDIIQSSNASSQFDYNSI